MSTYSFGSIGAIPFQSTLAQINFSEGLCDVLGSFREQCLELRVADFSRLICVYFVDQSFDVYRHIKLLLNDLDQLVGYNIPRLVWLSAHRNERLQCIVLIVLVLQLLIVSDCLQEVLIVDISLVLSIDLAYHFIDFFSGWLLTKFFQHFLKLLSLEGSVPQFIVGVERFLACFQLFST